MFTATTGLWIGFSVFVLAMLAARPGCVPSYGARRLVQRGGVLDSRVDLARPGIRGRHLHLARLTKGVGVRYRLPKWC